jgi:hypothetical protein
MDGCIRCSKELFTEEDLLTGICADCWTAEDNDEEDK